LAATALVALLPELELLIGAWRRRYTGDGPRGMPPHVTLIFPFADSAEVDGRLERLQAVFGAFSPFEAGLLGTERFPGLLYLRPEPAKPFTAITEALIEAFPEFPPYGGAFEEIVPHVTVAQGDDEILAAAERELATQLPVAIRVERAWLVEDTPGGWRRHTSFPLERRRSV
jgi:2'-5' RNA ligase